MQNRPPKCAPTGKWNLLPLACISQHQHQVFWIASSVPFEMLLKLCEEYTHFKQTQHAPIGRCNQLPHISLACQFSISSILLASIVAKNESLFCHILKLEYSECVRCMYIQTTQNMPPLENGPVSMLIFSFQFAGQLCFKNKTTFLSHFKVTILKLCQEYTNFKQPKYAPTGKWNHRFHFWANVQFHQISWLMPCCVYKINYFLSHFNA